MGTIRRLTESDVPAIEAVIDSRSNFQGNPVNDWWISEFKLYYVEKRIVLDNHFFYGYFDDLGELIAFKTAHNAFNRWTYFDGVAFTVPGKNLEKWNGSRWPASVIELTQQMLTDFDAAGMVDLYVIGPHSSKWERLVEVPGFQLADRTLWKREDVGVIEANHKTGIYLYDEFLVSGTLSTDQLVMKFTLINPQHPLPPPPPSPKLPSNSPPRGEKSATEVHPPRDMIFGDGPGDQPKP